MSDSVTLDPVRPLKFFRNGEPVLIANGNYSYFGEVVETKDNGANLFVTVMLKDAVNGR